MNTQKFYFILLGGLFAFSSQAFAFYQQNSFADMTKSYQLAEIIFLPDYEEKKIPLHYQENCANYKFTKDNCFPPKELSNPCPDNNSKYMYCRCNPSKYKYTSQNCVYTAEAPYFPDANRLLSGDMCRTDNFSQLYAQSCNCIYFRYTTDESCGNKDKVLDKRSYCQENNGIIRYENCRCNPEKYPYLFVGKFRSQEFLDEVYARCGNENNFISCQNYGEEIAFKCAVDPSYKYDSYSCQLEHPSYQVSGESIKFTNGYGQDITLYKECDCPTTFSTSCDGASSNRFYTTNGKILECQKKSPLCQMGFFKGFSDDGLTSCFDNIHGSLIRVAETCIKRDGRKVYRCECSYRSGKYGYSGDFCGTCVKNTPTILCVENGQEISSSCLNQL